MSYSNFMTLLMVLMLILTFAFITWQGKKQMERENDERWKRVIEKSNMIALHYYEIVILIVTTVTGLERFFHLEAFITQAKICIFTVIIVWLKYLVQHFAIRYFDKCL